MLPNDRPRIFLEGFDFVNGFLERMLGPPMQGQNKNDPLSALRPVSEAKGGAALCIALVNRALNCLQHACPELSDQVQLSEAIGWPAE